MAALTSLLEQGDRTDAPAHLAGEFLAIRRLVASKAGFAAFTRVEGFKEKIGGKVRVGERAKRARTSKFISPFSLSFPRWSRRCSATSPA